MVVSPFVKIVITVVVPLVVEEIIKVIAKK